MKQVVSQKPWLFALCFSATAIATSFGASAKTVDWNASKTDTGAFIADCRNCDENISLAVDCKNGEKLWDVMFQLLEQRDEKLADQPANVTVSVGGKTLTVAATYTKPGEAGPFPIAKIPGTDPFFELLSHGNEASFSVNGITSKLGLKGSKKALGQINKLCK